MKIGSNCSVCGKKLIGKQTLFCSTKCKNVVHQSYQAQKKRGLERKLYFVKKLGGKCSICGYSTNLSALAFHHTNGLNDKKFQIDVRAFSNRKIGPILEEVAKCKLLCHNCHAEVHNPNLDLAKLLIEPTALTTELPPLNAP
jgi:predicted nucleic acid-binding Zn ribbon protein